MKNDELATDDLPAELKKQLRANKRPPTRVSKWRPAIMTILGNHGDMCLNQLLVELYRAKNKIMTRVAMVSHLSALRKDGLVEKHSHRRYQLSKDGQARLNQARDKVAKRS